MNEHIKKLLDRALDQAVPETWTQLSHEQMTRLSSVFAELIVQECVTLAKSKSEYIQSMETDDRGDQAQIHSLAWQFEEFGYKIKKHFGVEE